MDADLLDAVVRLVRLVDDPGGEKVLAPLVEREIMYRLLVGGEGARLGHLVASSRGDTRRISRAIGRLREHYDEPLRIEEISREPGMSISGFHHHFKSVTAISPLQFQKQIRLQEARRLMLGEELDAASAGTAWAMRIRRTSAATTRSCSARRRSARHRETAWQPRTRKRSGEGMRPSEDVKRRPTGGRHK